MAKEVQMSIKLRDRFMGIAASKHRPAAQIVRDLMRLYIENNKIPNVLIVETIRKCRRGEEVFSATSAEDLFKQLGI